MRLIAISTVVFSIFSAFTSVNAQISPPNYDDTLWIPVTYYDFHSNGSNPEFEIPHQGRVRTNMVANVLDADKKPTPGTVPYLNNYVKYWYRPWASSAQGDFTKPSYTQTGGNEFNATIVYNGPVPTDHDTAFKKHSN